MQPKQSEFNEKLKVDGVEIGYLNGDVKYSIGVDPASGPESSVAVIPKSYNSQIVCQLHNLNPENIQKALGFDPGVTRFCEAYFSIKVSTEKAISAFERLHRYAVKAKQMRQAAARKRVMKNIRALRK